MKLACADFTWPLLSHERVIELIRILEIEGVDLGLFGNRSHIRPEVVREDVPMWAGVLKERLDRAEVELADFYFQPWTDAQVMAMNNPDPKQKEDSRALFLDMLEMARRLEANGISTLPGVPFDGQSWDDAMSRSTEELQWRVDQAGKHGIELSVEGHIGSIVDTPDKLMQLVDRTPGLKLTLDYGHFTYAGIPDSEVEPLIEHSRHFHCRGSAEGELQTSFLDNKVDFRRIIERMQEVGYPGYFAIEYVYMNPFGANRSENTTETILYRDFARAAMEGRDYTPPEMF